MTFADLWRRENAVQALDFWLDYEGVPRARRRTERREVRAMLDDLARSDLADQFVREFTDRSAQGRMGQGVHVQILGGPR